VKYLGDRGGRRCGGDGNGVRYGVLVGMNGRLALTIDGEGNST
jgi:hypothetical protein